jgi:hypothetical protein
VLLVVPLSLLAALLFALAAAFQQRAAQRAARASEAEGKGEPRSRAESWLPVLGFTDRLLSNRLWLLGWATNLAGFLAQAAALHFGSIAVVQPLLVAQLLFALPLSVAASHCRLLPRDWSGAAAICGGLVILLAVRGVAVPAAKESRAHVLLATVAATGLIALLVTVARRYRSQPQVRAALESVAAGICFALTAVFITLTADDLFHRGVPATAVDWPGYALAGSTLLGLLLEQDAFAAGSLATAVAAMTITNPIASYLLGVLAFDADAPDDPGALAGLASAGLLIVVGVIMLSGSPTVRGQFVIGAGAAGEAGRSASCDGPEAEAGGKPEAAEPVGASGSAGSGGSGESGESAGAPDAAQPVEVREGQPKRRARLR